MSLVAYAASSDEESSSDNEDAPGQQTRAILVKPLPAAVAAPKQAPQTTHAAADCISDEEEADDDGGGAAGFSVEALSLSDLHKPIGYSALSLPKPRMAAAEDQNDDDDADGRERGGEAAPTFATLPQPKSSAAVAEVIEEHEDEFLRKKAETLEKPPPPPPTKGPVRISIPSLRHFADVDADKSARKQAPNAAATQKASGLLGILPPAKSEQNFAVTKTAAVAALPSEPTAAGGAAGPSPGRSGEKPARSMLIPDTVKNRRPAYNTEGVDGIRAARPSKKPAVAKPSKPVAGGEASDSDEEMGERRDFFSLSKEEDKLPEVNANEIAAMVAKRAAKMADAQTKFLESPAPGQDQEMSDAGAEEELRQAQKRYQELDAVAIEALEGSGQRKRRRRQGDAIEVLDISGSQILPDRDEWMRTALASATTYQATGVLNDEEPAAGTRRKHQITYLAHKAKANEAELQAMWSVNRQNRRATQSKYGF